MVTDVSQRTGTLRLVKFPKATNSTNLIFRLAHLALQLALSLVLPLVLLATRRNSAISTSSSLVPPPSC